jgi:hypothetical protein
VLKLNFSLSIHIFANSQLRRNFHSEIDEREKFIAINIRAGEETRVEEGQLRFKKIFWNILAACEDNRMILHEYPFACRMLEYLHAF